MCDETHEAQLRARNFQDAFHFVAEKDFWPLLRQETQVNKYSDVQVTISSDGAVNFSSLPLSDTHEAVASTFFRKFISGGDDVYLGKILDSLRVLEIESNHTREANKIFDQLTKAHRKIYVKNGRSIGTYLNGVPIIWSEDRFLKLENHESIDLSLKDFTEVTFNEGMFHPFSPNKNEGKRAAIRTTIEPLRKAMSNIALSGTIYACIAIHYELRLHDDFSCLHEACAENQLLKEHA